MNSDFYVEIQGHPWNFSSERVFVSLLYARQDKSK